jgi:hypothetical protein
MRIGKQGGKTPPNSLRSESSIEVERSRNSAEYRDRESDEEERIENQRGLGSKASMSSMWSGATAGSEASYFPRWSWEGDREWGIDSRKEKYAGAEVVYEVCVKCLQERRVTLADLGGESTDALLHHDEEPRAVLGGEPRAILRDVGESTEPLAHSTQRRSIVPKDSADTLVEHDYGGDLRAGYGPDTGPENGADHRADHREAHRYAQAYAEGIQRNEPLNVEINGARRAHRTRYTHAFAQNLRPRPNEQLHIEVQGGLNPNVRREWNGGGWNNEMTDDWYARRGVREGGQGSL